MKRMWTALIAAIMMLGFFAPGMPYAYGQEKPHDADSAAITKVIADFIDSFNRHDAKGWAQPFAEDGDFTNVTGLTRHGRKEVEERFADLFATRLKTAHRTAKVLHIRYITPDVASGDADWELVGSKASDGSANPVRKGLFTWVMTRRNGQWQFDDFHESEYAPAR